jgi:adenylate kinase
MQSRRTIFIGPPGSGKGTHAPRAVEAFGLKHLSTGDMLRDAMKKGSSLGRQAQAIMLNGELVGDELVAGVVAEAVQQQDCASGFILDGFPRTIEQAHMLDALMAQNGQAIDAVVSLEISDDLLVKRITGRMVHPGSGRSYNIFFNPPKVEGIDDVTGEPLVKRGDDTEEKLRTRIEVFHSKTKPVLDHYRSKVITIRADQLDIDVISADIVSALKALQQRNST